MPGGSAKKQSPGSDSAKKNTSNSSVRNVSGSSGSRRARKRKRCQVKRFSDSDLESELEDMEDAVEIEKKLRKVAKENDLSHDEMRQLIQKFVKNEHILALVTLKAEDEIERERQESEQPAIIITDTPSVPKLTRARARELNKTPGITLPVVNEIKEPEIATLIQDELNSDEDDEEYVFKEEDFISDEDPNSTVSDLDSNPRTPQTPLSQTEAEDSPVKLTADGCFKIPLEKPKSTREDVRIAARTRSKLCLEQTAIEDIESEFVPPDVEQIDLQDFDMTANDEDWMQFLNDFSKPLSTSFVADEDDPINDPEYVAAEKILEDAEELRDVNIPRKELTDLVAELFEGLVNEGVSLESIELDTPQKFLLDNFGETTITEDKNMEPVSDKFATPTIPDKDNSRIVRELNFDTPTTRPYNPPQQQPNYITDVPPLVPLSNRNNMTINDYSFNPNVVSTPSTQLQAPVAYTNSPDQGGSQIVTLPPSNFSSEPEWIAVKIPGQNNSYQLARVVPNANAIGPPPLVRIQPQRMPARAPEPTTSPKTPEHPLYSVPYDTNFTWEYISIRKHVYTEYLNKFETNRNMSNNISQMEELSNQPIGFTKHQHDILQQQLRIHVQMLTQTFIQSYSHPMYWKLSFKAKDMLLEIENRAQDDASFRAWNLQLAVNLIRQWEEDLNKDTKENKELMKFIHSEINSTKSNCRQVPRFPPRIMEFVINSEAFMYPEYLPRIPFTSRRTKYEAFAPAEMQLIAMGLERHIQKIRQTGERISKKTSELKVAVERLTKDTVYGKSFYRIWTQVKCLRNADYFNPVKYYFEHKRAPPVQHKLIYFENNKVLPPKDRYTELPLAWQTHIDEKRRAERRKRGVYASEAAGSSYLEFVREALGENIKLPESTTQASTPDNSGANSSWFSQTNNNSFFTKTRSKRSIANCVTINVNYHFTGITTIGDAQPPVNNTTALAIKDTSSTDKDNLNASDYQNANIASYNYDWGSKTLQPILEPLQNGTSLKSTTTQCASEGSPLKVKSARRKLHLPTKFKAGYNKNTRFRTLRRSCHIFERHNKNKRQRQQRISCLLNCYRKNLKRKEVLYKRVPIVRKVYRYFKALELYTDLLRDLKMACRNATSTTSGTTTGNAQPISTNSSTAVQHLPTTKFFVHSSQQYFGKRTRGEEESNVCSRSKKASRQEENFKHMLLPDTAEDANRKDAIYALNFYEKVEEALKASNRSEGCKKFNHILKTFDPRRDKVADLYYKLEQLFLPEHPELAQVFLTFLLPSEAVEIGKFFEHFMINNMTTFINKLNIYFNKQPAQIRKIYNCLAELAEDPEVTMKKVETKILPLLKGNQFLIDWFLQQFTEAKPPERIFSTPEHVNLKEVEIKPNLYETLNDSHEVSAPCCELQQQQQQQNQTHNCQLRYINGRIFYGNKMTLPAKLSFMANNCQHETAAECNNEELLELQRPECVHGIREHGEKQLAVAVDKAAANAAADCNSDDNDKSEEEDLSKVLIVDMPNDEDTSSSLEICDDTALRAHAMRLNPSYYANTCFAPVTSTPNTSSNYAPHHANAKKSSLNFNDDGKIVSPRKHSTPGTPTCANTSTASLTPLQCLSPNNSSATSSALTTTTLTAPTTNAVGSNSSSDSNVDAQIPQQLRDKRKSPTKKIKSPVSATRVRPSGSNLQPMVVVYEHNPAIACAKKLKSLIAEEDYEGEIDNKDRIAIVACAKKPGDTSQESSVAEDGVVLQSHERRSVSPHTPPLLTVTKLEHSDNSDDLEFIPENAEVSHSFSHDCFDQLQEAQHVEDSDLQEVATTATSTTAQTSSVSHPTATNENYTEDCKLEVVATLSASTPDDDAATYKSNQASVKASTAWTREEDKLILIEMKLSAGIEKELLFKRMHDKLPSRSLAEVKERYNFLIDFLSKLQGK
uniref:GON-4-like protein n=2 Tax=Bactrocera dorsalis TaxID=27457 RepID=A0A034WK91_BACDO